MRSLSRFLPIIAGAAAGAVIAALISSGGGTKTVTTTTTVPAVRSALPVAGSKGLTINQLYKMTNPGVVDITTSGTQSGGVFGFGQQQTQGEGAGVVYDNKGNILTDQHVIQGASTIKVNFSDGHSATASVVGSDPGADVAVIHVGVPSSWLHPLNFADSSNVQVGDSVIAGMRREARTGEFRSNLHRGGAGTALELEPQFKEVALRAARVIGLDIAVTRLEGKYKLSQNRPAADRPSVIAALEAQSDPESHAVARLMRDREPV